MRCLKFENQGNPVNQRKSHKVAQVLRSILAAGALSSNMKARLVATA